MTVPRKTGRGQWVCCFSPLVQCSLSLHKDWSGLPPIKYKSAVLCPQGLIQPSTGPVAYLLLLFQCTLKGLHLFSLPCSIPGSVSGVLSVPNDSVLPGKSQEAGHLFRLWEQAGLGASET